MNRNDKRKLERQKVKNEKWIQSLNPNQIAIVRGAIKEGVANDLERYLNVAQIVFSSILLTEIGMTVEKSEAIMDKFDKEFVEFSKWADSKADGWMIYLKENDTKVKDRIKELIIKGDKQKDIVAKIKKEFDVPNAAAKRSYEVVKEELEIDYATEYIFEDDVVEVQEVERIEQPMKKQNFKILNQKVSMEIEGQFEKYKLEKSNDDVTLTVLSDTEAELSFDSVEAIEQYMAREIEQFNKKIEELKDIISI